MILTESLYSSIHALQSAIILFSTLRRLSVNCALLWLCLCAVHIQRRTTVGVSPHNQIRKVLYYFSSLETSLCCCCVCMEECNPVIFWPCAHSVCCLSCTAAACSIKQQCPVCRVIIHAAVVTQSISQSPHRDKACRPDTSHEAQE